MHWLDNAALLLLLELMSECFGSALIVFKIYPYILNLKSNVGIGRNQPNLAQNWFG
jgi:hypothetical protein